MVRNVLVLVVLLGLSPSIIGQNSKTVLDSIAAQELDAVVVSATRTQRQISSLPMPTQFIPQKEIESINAIRLTDLLE